MAISSIGVGSGLPLDELLNDLRKAENQSLALIDTRRSTEEARLSGYSKIKSALDALKTAAEKLGKQESYGALAANSSSDKVTVKADNNAIAGSYDIHVSQLATHQRLTSSGFESRSDALSTTTGGTLKITLADGSSQELVLDDKAHSLEDMVKAINSDSKLGVNATIVNTGDANEPYRLFLSASGTGTDAAIASIEVTDNAELNDKFGFNSAGNTGIFTETAAKNAELTINGLAVQSQTNTVENAINGVTLTLNGRMTDPADTAQVSLTRDDSVAKKTVEDFVKAYNNVLTTIKSQTSYDVEAQKGSALVGDSLARRVQSQVRDTLNVFAADGDIRSLSQMGITTNPTTGELKIDDKKLDAALKDNLTDVTKLLAGPESGLSKRVADMTDNFLRKDGYFDIANDSINKNITQINRQYEAAQDRIDAKMENYRRQFSGLDRLVSEMNGISSYLTTQLDMLANLSTQGKK